MDNDFIVTDSGMVMLGRKKLHKELGDTASYTDDGDLTELLKERTRTRHPLCAGRKCPKCLKRMRQWSDWTEFDPYSDEIQTGVNFECHQDDGGCGYSVEIEFSPCEDPSSSSDYIESTADRTGNCMICGEELEKEIVDIAAGRMSIYTCLKCNGNDETGKDSHWAHFKIRIFEPIDWYATD